MLANDTDKRYGVIHHTFYILFYFFILQHNAQRCGLSSRPQSTGSVCASFSLENKFVRRELFDGEQP